MITQFIKSINWVDVALAVLFVRIVFISVTTCFVTELFKIFGVIAALFVSFQYFSALAAMAAQKTSLSLASWQFLMYVFVASVIYVSVKFLRDGIMIIFKVETTHQGVDKYGAGVLGVGRAILLCSMVVVGLMMLKHPYIHQQTFKSWGYKAVAYAAPNTYRFLQQQFVGKLLEKEKLNDDVFALVASHGANPK